MTGPDEIRKRWEAWQAADGEQATGPAPIAKVVGKVLDDLEQQQVVQRWRLYGAERQALADLARRLGKPQQAIKLYLAHVGLVLAHAEEADPLIPRAIHHARCALADEAPPSARFVEMPPGLAEEDAIADISLAELAEHPHAPGFAVADLQAVAELRAVATAPQERELIDAFLNEGCSTFEDVRRLLGWSKGHAATVARRLRAKALRKSAA